MPPGKSSRRRAGVCTIAVLALACAGAAATSSTAVVGEAPRLSNSVVEDVGTYAPGEAIVRFEPGTSSTERRDARREARVDHDSSLGLPRAQVVDVEGSVQAAVRRLERQPGVAYAQPNYRYEALAALAPEPDDPFFEELWGLSDPAKPDPGIGALEAWESSKKGADQVIAVVDTGVDLTHPDIISNLWTNFSPGPDEDLHGYDFVDEDGNPDDYDFHGTHVAATAAATADNAQGIAGVAPEAEVMAIRVLDGDGSGFTSDIAAGIAYAAEHGADVINLSLGGPAGGDKATEDAIGVAAAEDAIVVAAAGNEGVDNDVEPHTPCALPQTNLICVAALNQSGSLAGFSNFGAKSVDLAAPGTSILSAKTDYKAVFSEGFDNPGLSGWDKVAISGFAWGGSNSVFSTGTHSAADSPGFGENYAPNSNTQLIRSAAEPVDLTSERGCRSHFDLRRNIQPPVAGEFTDELLAGAIAGVSEDQDALSFAGSSKGEFRRAEVSISDLDGQADVLPAFALFSDDSDERDGAYIDDLQVLCRDDASYLDAISLPSEYDEPDSGNYVEFNGTSMATPHVAGVVALVRSAVPGLSAQQVIDAVLGGTSPIPNVNPAKPTATQGIADACQAIAVATGGDIGTDCPGSSEHSVPPDGGGAIPPLSEIEEAIRAANPAANPSPPTVSDRTRPRTFLRKRPGKVIRTRHPRTRVVFEFGASESGVTFYCRVDGGFLRICPRRFIRRFRVGLHVLRVMARDAAGNVDRTPAVYRFQVKRRR